MPNNLTKDQQLTAAQSQLRNWKNQYVAQSGGYLPTPSQYGEQMAAILNTGLYPDLDMGKAGSSNTVEYSQFFVVGTGNFSEDRGSGYSGSPLFTSGISDTTTLNQFTAAQDAYASGLEQVYQTQGKDLASQAQAAQNALAAAKARVQALETQLAADAPVEPQPTSSAAAQAASSAANQKLGQEISPQRETQLSAIDQQYSDYRSSGTVVQNAPNQATQQSAARDAQLQNIDSTYTAQGSGSGSDVTKQTVDNRNEYNYKQTATDATEIESTNTNSDATSKPYNEDSNANGVQGTTDNSVYTDQEKTSSSMADRAFGSGSSGIDTGKKSPTGSDSVTVLSSGASGKDNTFGQKNNANPNSGGNATRVNKLHNYANYTYRLSLYAVPRDTINAIFASKTTPTNQQILNGSVFICSDSGSGPNARTGEFPVDLSIDNLELETIVNANNSRTRATDVIKLKFDIIEPYTVNFLGRLMKLSASVNPKGNWSTMFFVLKIEFMGYTDTGTPVTPSGNGETIPQTTKFIPFTMISMKFNVGSSGGKYAIDGIPVNALALTALDNQIPFHVEVSGMSVNDLFNEELASTTKSTSTGGAAREETTVLTQNTINGNQTVVRKGLDKGLNENEKQKVAQKTQQKPNEYYFEFDSKIANAKVVDPEKYFKVQGVPGTSGKDANEIQKGKVGSLIADIKAGVFRANPGTRITDFISSVITVSTYMTEQHQIKAGDPSNRPLLTWKITPVVEFQDIDETTNFYARKITYVVTPYTTLGQDAPNFGQAQVTQDRIVKTYKYIYSGDNRDVLEANVEFQMAFFELRNGVPMNYINNDGLTPGQPQPNQVSSPRKDNRFFMPRYQYTNGLANRQNTGPTTVDLTAIGVQELMEKLFDNRGDMITLDITIIGDPDWISQDYPIMHPTIVGDAAWLQNGSVNFSNAVYFNFYFATPNTDYNETSGLFNPQGNYSEFSGIYQVVSVKSNFSGGKFTQKLTNFRVRNQEEVKSFSIRNDSGSNLAAARNAERQLEKATNSVVVAGDPRVDKVPITNNTAKVSNSPVYNVTDPRVALPAQKNTWIEDSLPEDAAIRDYYLGVNQ